MRDILWIRCNEFDEIACASVVRIDKHENVLSDRSRCEEMKGKGGTEPLDEI